MPIHRKAPAALAFGATPTSGTPWAILAAAGLAGAAASVLAQGPLQDPFPASIQLGDLDGAIGFRLSGIDALDQSGVSVASAGDVNGDGIDDVIIGALLAWPGGRAGAGSSYVVFGRDTASGPVFPADFSLADLNGTNGFRLDGATAGERSGCSVAQAGDVNGDGIDDLIIGAFAAAPGGRSRAGSSYVVFGRDAASGDTFPAAIELADLNGEDGFRMDGVAAWDYSGTSVASAGDINGDGVDDLVVGAPRADAGRPYGSGVSYVVFGRDAAAGARFPPSLRLVALDGHTGFRLNGVARFDRSGSSVASAGDVNGDGLGDLIIGARGADPRGVSDAGSGYVVFGRDAASGAAFPEAIALADLDGASGFRLDGVDANDWTGFSVASAGDVNGDGVDDVIIGAYGADTDTGSGFGAGSSYVVFGQDVASGAAFPAAIELASLDGVSGFRLDGVRPQDFSGRSVASAGDLNGDGVDDLIVGANRFDLFANGLDAGASYVVFGRDLARAGCPADLDGDGELTVHDFMVFQNLFDGMDPRADFDGDGSFTLFDFLAFQNLFDVGCG